MEEEDEGIISPTQAAIGITRSKYTRKLIYKCTEEEDASECIFYNCTLLG